MFPFLIFILIITVWLFYVETPNQHLEDLDILSASKSPLAYKARREYDEKKRTTGLISTHQGQTSETKAIAAESLAPH